MVVCFYGVNEENGYLSNFWLSDFELDGVKFSSAEQYMMYAKARAFADTKTAEKILSTNDCRRIKQLGRQVKGYNEFVWGGTRQLIMLCGLTAKFSQNEDLKEKLLSTGNNVLAECSTRDKIWGIGLSLKDERRLNTYTWQGRNLLGFTLMQVRSNLR